MPVTAAFGGVSIPLELKVNGLDDLIATNKSLAATVKVMGDGIEQLGTTMQGSLSAIMDFLTRLEQQGVEMTEALNTSLDRISEDYSTLQGQVGELTTSVQGLQTANGELQTALDAALADQGEAVAAAVQAAVADAQASFNEQLNDATAKAAEIDSRVANPSDTPPVEEPVEEPPAGPVDETPAPGEETPGEEAPPVQV